MAFCYPCRMYTHGTGRAEPAFTTKGFRDWKHATGHKGALMEHSRSFTHRSAVVSWEQHSLNTKQGTTIERRLDKLGHRVIQENRHYLKTVAEVILLCAQAELPLRGHDESKSSLNPGNFMMMLKMISNHDVLVKKYLETSPGNARYTSPTIQNKLLGIMSDIVQKKISAEIQEAGYYIVMVDESKDVSKKEQLSIVLRYVLKGNVYERFLGFVTAEGLDVASLFNYIHKATRTLTQTVCRTVL